MESVSSCKEKLSHFRIKELKDVLTQLGLAKQGKKQDLLNRILATLSEDEAIVSEAGYFPSYELAVLVSKQGLPKKNTIGREGVAKIIDDIFRKLQLPGAMDLASKKQNGMDIKPKEEANDSFQLDMKVQCPCGSSLLTESMIQCEDSGCHVWQHIGCVIIPEKPTEGLPPVPSIFYCDLCRIKRADPFWVTLAHPLLPVKLTTSIVSTDGGNPVQNVEKTFQLTRADRDLLQKAEFDVQAWCMLLNDKVSFRMQWPQYSDLQVNGIPVRTTNRPGSQALGANGRDDGAAITSCTKEGTNKIFLSGCDARIFCLGVRIVRRRTVQQVLDMIPKESDGECFEDALARVCRCIGGGNAVEDADSDSDLEVVSDIVTVNLRCPMSGSRIKVAGRFKPCAHMACFDLDTFVGLNQRSRKWQCPLCLKNYSLEHMIIDPYFNRITTLLRDCGEDVNEIEVKPDGSWRAKNEREHRVLGLWHFPDGSLCPTADEAKIPDTEASKEDHKQEGPSGHNGLRLGIRKNRNGIWEVSKPENAHTRSPENRLHVKYENADAMPMSSSATGSCRDGEDPSINQDGGGQFGLSSNNANKLDSLSLNFDPTSTVANIVPSAAVGIENVIVLSDSEDENGNFISPETHYDSGQADPGDIPFSNPHTGIQDSYTIDPDLDTGGNCLGLYGDNCDDYGIPLWPLPSGTQSSPGFQFFGTEANVPESFVDLERASAACPPTMNGYALTPDVVTRTASQVANSNSYPNTGISGDLVDNPLALGEVDPSLQMFLPSGPAGTSAPLDLGNQPDIPNGGVTEDWISLRLGGGSSSSSHGETVDENDLNSRLPVASKEDKMDSLTNAASLLLGMNDDQSHRTTPKRPLCDGLLSHPRQPRSARPRLNLSIDSNQKYISIDSDSD